MWISKNIKERTKILHTHGLLLYMYNSLQICKNDVK